MACSSLSPRAHILLVLVLGADCAAVISWVSEPVLPNQSFLLAASSKGGLSNQSVVEVRQGVGWVKAETTGFTPYGCVALLPSDFRTREFEIRVDNGPVFTANMARPWFLFGDRGSHATAGGWIRAVGVGIGLNPPATVATLVLQRGGAELRILARNTSTGDGVGARHSRWHAFFDIPSSLAPGEYDAAIASYEGSTPSKLCTFLNQDEPCLASFNVTTPGNLLPAKPDVFNLANFGAVQPGPGRDHTSAVHGALVAAKNNGGGVVYLPRGQYFVEGAILIPPGTVLRGEGTELVSIFFKEDNQTSAPRAYVTSSEPAPWGIEHISIYVTAFANNVVQFQPETDGAFMRYVRIRYNSYFCLEPQKGSSSRGRTADWDFSVGVAVMLAGRNLFVTDNDIYSSGDVVSTLYNGAAGAEYMHIARNRFWNGGTTHWGVSWRQCIYEDNQATGVSVAAMGSNYPQYAHDNGEPHVQNIFHHNNTQQMIWGNDREMMTCDGGGGVYFGGAVQDDTGLHIKLARNASGSQPGGAMCVLSGMPLRFLLCCTFHASAMRPLR